MGGVGNFNRNNRTLYVGNLVTKKDERAVEKLVKSDFCVFGQVEYVRVILTKAIAFVRFKLRSAAEFALSAMEDQKTEYGDITVKWANVDPNPLAKEFERRADEALAQYAIAKRIQEMNAKQRNAWEQVQDIQNGVYPNSNNNNNNNNNNNISNGLLPPPNQQQQQQQGGGGGRTNPMIGLPEQTLSDIDVFASYWGQYYSREFQQEFGENIPPPSVNEVPPPDLDNSTNTKTMHNPYTGEVVKDDVVVNPYNQAPHPYAYRDYGWNRPKLSKAEKEKRQKKREQRKRNQLEETGEDDPNSSYGPSGQKRVKRLIGRTKKNKAVATQAENEAMSNDQPLEF